jgi:hypothetical protein
LALIPCAFKAGNHAAAGSGEVLPAGYNPIFAAAQKNLAASRRQGAGLTAF